MPLLTDTTPEVHALQIQLLRETPVWRKLELMTGLIDMTRALALSSLRADHPTATEAELHRLLADRLLGRELATAVYGPVPKPDSSSDAI